MCTTVKPPIGSLMRSTEVPLDLTSGNLEAPPPMFNEIG